MKLKTLIRVLICHFIRAISKAKSILIEGSKQNQLKLIFYAKKTIKKQKNISFGSFRLHYNWCSSHVVPVPVPAPMPDELCKAHLYYDSTWNSVFSTDPDQCFGKGDIGVINGEDHNQSELSGYLQWLEGKVSDDKSDDNGDDKKDTDDIDRLADMFIARCHEKFLLEKVESDRRFEAMLARGL